MSVGTPIELANAMAIPLEPLTVRLQDETIRQVSSLGEIEYWCDYLTLTRTRVWKYGAPVDTLPIVANIDGIKMIESRERLWLVPPSSPEPPVHCYLPGNLWRQTRPTRTTM